VTRDEDEPLRPELDGIVARYRDATARPSAAARAREAAALGALARSLRGGAPVGRRPRLPLALGLACAAVVTAVAALALLRTPAPTFAGAWTPAGRDAHVARGEPATITVRRQGVVRARAGAQVRRPVAGDRRTELPLTRGALSLTADPGARWRIAPGPYRIDAAGSELDVDFLPSSRLTVAVRSGGARLAGPIVEDGIDVAAGERVIVDVAGKSVAREPVDAAPAATARGAAPALVAQTARALAVTPAVTSTWLGTSVPGTEAGWLPHRITALHARPDGTLFVLAGSDVPLIAWTTDALVVRHGAFVRRIGTEDDRRGLLVGNAVAGNDRHVFVALTLATPGGRAAALGRYDGNGRPVPAPGGSPDGALPPFDPAEVRPPIRALAADGRTLFVAHDRDGGTVSRFDAETLAPLGSFAAAAPRALAVDRGGLLWVLGGGAGPALRAYTPDGRAAPRTGPDARGAVALAVDGRGRLLVAYGPPRAQVVAFALGEPDEGSPPQAVRTIGAEGGVLGSGGREVDAGHLHGIAAVAADAAGRAYVGMTWARDWGTRLAAFDDRGTLAWQVEALANFESGVVDPESDGRALFTTAGRYELDLRRPRGQEAKLVGWTVDPERHPDDVRLREDASGTVELARVGDARLLAYLSVARAGIYRFAPGRETAVPVALMGIGPTDAPPNDALGAGAWLWTDRDGDGRRQIAEYARTGLSIAYGTWVDERGQIWWATATEGIVALPPLGLDERGAPIYRAEHARRFPMPAPFRQIQRVRYDAAQDTLYVAGYARDRPSPYRRGEWTAMGGVLARYDGWSTAPRLRWRVDLDTRGGLGRRPNGFAVAGDRVFVSHHNDRDVRVLDAETGAPLYAIAPGPELGGRLNTARADGPLHAYRRADGAYLLFAAFPLQARIALFDLVER
jgi:hypothetical protein